MKITRIIALAIITGTTGAAGIQAQTLRPSSPPAEFPPGSYKGRQFVDSRGCVYIRAGIDGNVTWVPRVTRSRKQVCGYQPTKLAGTTRQQSGAQAPELITLEPSQQPAQTAAAQPAPAKQSPAKPAPAAANPAAATTPPKVVTTAKPRRTQQTTTARPAPSEAAPAPKPAAKKVVRVTPKPATAPAAPAPETAGSSCEGLSDISRQYTNASGARCGPQTAAPVTYGGQEGEPHSTLRLTPNTRVVQKHIYQDRRLSNSFTVPEGYRPVWTDGRLNPQRAVRTVRPAVVTGFAQAPAGYQMVERTDNRLNPMRGVRTPEGDAQMAQIWTNGVPRRLAELPLDRPAVTLPREARYSQAEAGAPAALRLSTRSAPGAQAPRRAAAPARYVRAATFADAAQAKAAARKLASTGLPVRLGTVSRRGQPYKVVLAGPFQAQGQAAAALTKVQRAGFSGARLSK